MSKMMLLAIVVSVALAVRHLKLASPIISLDLSSPIGLTSLNHTISDETSGAICHTKQDYLLIGDGLSALEAPDSCVPDGKNSYKRSFVKYCKVLVDNADSCPEPKASAWDHHDGNLDVLKTIKLVITSQPQQLPQKADKFVDVLDYSRRSEYALTYDAEDITGNKAERMTFAMVIADHEPPKIRRSQPSPDQLEACDQDQNRVFLRAPLDANDCMFYEGEHFWDQAWVSTADATRLGLSNGQKVWFEKYSTDMRREPLSDKPSTLRVGPYEVRELLMQDQTQCSHVEGCGGKRPVHCNHLNESVARFSIREVGGGEVSIHQHAFSVGDHLVIMSDEKGDPQFFAFDSSAQSTDNYDGDVTSTMEWFVTPPDQTTARKSTFIDTKILGHHIIRYTSHDYASLFGTNQQNNVATSLAHINVVDTIPPIVYCASQDFSVRRGRFHASPIEEHAAESTEECAMLCEKQQWKRQVGSVTNPPRCEYFDFDPMVKGQNCRLFADTISSKTFFGSAYDCTTNEDYVDGLEYYEMNVAEHCPKCAGRGSEYSVDDRNTVERVVSFCQNQCDQRNSCYGFFVHTRALSSVVCGFYSSDMRDGQWKKVIDGYNGGNQLCEKSTVAKQTRIQGHLYGCDSPVEMDCGSSRFADPGAVCMDMRDSWVDGKLSPHGVVVKTNASFDSRLAGRYSVTYSCVDEAGNQAIAKARPLRVVDREKPAVTLKGLFVRQIKCGEVESNEAMLRNYSSYGIGFTATDGCEGGLTEDACEVSVHQHSCEGKMLCKVQTMGASATCTWPGRRPISLAEAFSVGTRALKYQCIDSSGNSVTACRTILNIDSQLCHPTPAPTPFQVVGRNSGLSPVDCAVSTWTAWDNCTEFCGGGVQQRVRSIKSSPTFNGLACPVLMVERECNKHDCPVNCEHRWLPWTTCTKTCGSGWQSRIVKIIKEAGFGGKLCPLGQERVCHSSPCPANCLLSDWAQWSDCSATCKGGTQYRRRQISRHATHGGQPCAALSQHRECATHECPINCEVSSWSGWTTCSQKCGGGIKSRSRNVQVVSRYLGKPCPPTSLTEDCNSFSCSMLCERVFSAWSVCSTTCGGGVQTRRAQMTSEEGVQCPQVEDRACNTLPCGVDCVLSFWGDWTKCTKTCGSGLQYRDRSVLATPMYGGESCGHVLESQQCNTNECQVDCVLSSWGEWSQCTAECDGGVQTRSRSVLQPAQYSKPCPTTESIRFCSRRPCALHCEVFFGPWSGCSATCGSGVRKREVNGTAAPIQCPATTAEECNLFPCPNDCSVSSWTAWTPCPTCNSRELIAAETSTRRTRTISTVSVWGGRACPALIQSKICPKCNSQEHSGCVVSKWTAWSNCSHSCGPLGRMNRTRVIVVQPALGTCPSLVDSRTCNNHPCPVSCEVSAWGQWSACSAKCGPGNYKNCQIKACPAVCYDHWMDWTPCSKTCGTGVQTRPVLSIKIAEFVASTTTCSLLQQRVCNSQSCGLDCVVTDWSDVMLCSKSCGEGIGKRVRRIVSLPVGHGKSCPHLIKSDMCNSDGCPLHCRVSEWSQMGACSQTCGQGYNVVIER